MADNSTPQIPSSDKPSFGRSLKRLFNDRLFIGFLVTAIVLATSGVLLLIWRLRPRDFAVPYQYSSLQGFDALGAWYQVVIYGAFMVMITAGNLALAALGYDKSRIASFFLVMGAVIFNLFALIIVFTLTSHLEI